MLNNLHVIIFFCITTSLPIHLIFHKKSNYGFRPTCLPSILVPINRVDYIDLVKYIPWLCCNMKYNIWVSWVFKWLIWGCILWYFTKISMQVNFNDLSLQRNDSRLSCWKMCMFLYLNILEMLLKYCPLSLYACVLLEQTNSLYLEL